MNALTDQPMSCSHSVTPIYNFFLLEKAYAQGRLQKVIMYLVLGKASLQHCSEAKLIIEEQFSDTVQRAQ
jgi:hypothetical protein